jgi:lipoprotein-releasing system ATP-binding protein
LGILVSNFAPDMQTALVEQQRRVELDCSRSADVLRVTNLRKAFWSPAGEKIEVLREVSFSVAAGEIVAIMGASGAGKSTLLYLLGGLEAADGGTIQMQINNEQATNPSLILKGQIGFVFQFHYLLPDLTALENVALPLMIARRDADESRRRATRALEAIGLGERLSHRIGYLSGGEQQRVAVARALITKPKLVLADEPTGNLDESIADELAGLLVNYCRAERAAVIIATHNKRVARLCDRILLLNDGVAQTVMLN